MHTITIRLNDDYELIAKNLKSLSISLGRNINLSDLLRHVLKHTNTKKSLYDLGYISFMELNSKDSIVKNGTQLNKRIMRK